MGELVWDQLGQRTFETGIDRGVLYRQDRIGVCWNGLTKINEKLADNSDPAVYFDGSKYLGEQLIGDYSATLNAITYPSEFLEFDGYTTLESGLIVDNQATRDFHISYRTWLGDDVSGVSRGYKIHLLYNLMAEASDVTYTTISSSVSPIEFSWDISSKPEALVGYRPTAHAIIDSRSLREDILEWVEGVLYGTDTTPPNLPPLQELVNLLLTYARFVVIDNGDGSWTASGPDEHFNMISATEFELLNVPAVYLNTVTYELSSEPLD